MPYNTIDHNHVLFLKAKAGVCRSVSLGDLGMSMCAVEGDPCLHATCIVLFPVTRSMCPCVTATSAKMIIRDQVMGASLLMPGRNAVPEICLDRYVCPEQPLAHNMPSTRWKQVPFSQRRMLCARHWWNKSLLPFARKEKKSKSIHSRPCIRTLF